MQRVNPSHIFIVNIMNELANHILVLITWASTQENLSTGFANNKGTDQPAHPCSTISAFVIRHLESIISKLSTSKISFFKLVSLAEETGLSLAFLDTLKTGFVVTRPTSTSNNDW